LCALFAIWYSGPEGRFRPLGYLISPPVLKP
jgi:hypothetical protein